MQKSTTKTPPKQGVADEPRHSVLMGRIASRVSAAPEGRPSQGGAADTVRSAGWLPPSMDELDGRAADILVIRGHPAW